MSDQLDLFLEKKPPEYWWKACWDWDGPVVGGYCEINTPIVRKENGETLYCYMEQCRVLEIRADGKVLAEIAMDDQDGKPWPKNGTRLLLTRDDIWPPTRQLRLKSER